MSIDLTGVEHHPAVKEITDVLCKRTQNTDRGFFHAVLAYFFGKMASCQRAVIVTKDRGEIPVNIYALALATSGYGKGHSVGIIEGEFLKGFKERFTKETMPVIAEQNMWVIANDRALRAATDPAEEYKAVEAQYRSAGAYPFTFDSGTLPAVKQLRTKLIIANCGAINLQIDEIGTNLVKEEEVLGGYLELYDQGLIKGKLVKNTAENVRHEEVDGKTPANMLLFGTPSKLLNAGAEEDAFISMLDTGYGRRCIFGMGVPGEKAYNNKTAAEIYADLIQPQNSAMVDKWAAHFHKLADAARHGWRIEMEDDVAIQLHAYRIQCEKAAAEMAEHEEIRKAEISHRYFKAMKLAGAFAFIDESPELEMEHLMSAILLVEESGTAFQSILTREKGYMKLAKYIAECDMDLTHADLNEALPFYKSGNAARNELMTMAMSWGYKNHIVIRKTFADGIEFFRGESLKETNPKEIVVSYSTHVAYNYLNEKVPFDMLARLFQAKAADGQPMHWVNHHLAGGHRAEENVQAGFNMVVLDVDTGANINQVLSLLKDYKFIAYTTKRHTETEHRFRLMIPTNYVLNLDAEDYREFVKALCAWLPFPVDEASEQRSKKWLTNPVAQVWENQDGQLLDVLRFIPKTSRNAEHKAAMAKVESLDNLERWFAERMGPGGRNNQMIKFAMALVDSGMTYEQVEASVLGFNKKLQAPLPEAELMATIMKSVAKRYTAPAP